MANTAGLSIAGSAGQMMGTLLSEFSSNAAAAATEKVVQYALVHIISPVNALEAPHAGPTVMDVNKTKKRGPGGADKDGKDKDSTFSSSSFASSSSSGCAGGKAAYHKLLYSNYMHSSS